MSAFDHLYDKLPWLGHAQDFDLWEQELSEGFEGLEEPGLEAQS